MVELIVGIIIALIIWIFTYLPVMGFAYIFLGEYSLGVLYLIPLIGLTAVVLYRHFVFWPERIHRAALSRKYNYPLHLDKKETPDQWNNGFKSVIHGGIVSTTQPNKQTDLNHCQQIVEKMSKDKDFDDLHRAFRLTGCHMIIKDSTGHTITRIV